jgi:hypothetical protein
MSTYETSATVEEQGRIVVAGVPFVPGTEVEVIIREKVAADGGDPPANVETSRLHMRELFARGRARNTEPVGPLRREELYDRKVLR